MWFITSLNLVNLELSFKSSTCNSLVYLEILHSCNSVKRTHILAYVGFMTRNMELISAWNGEENQVQGI